MDAKNERYHGLDLLRGFAMMLGLLMHAPLAYTLGIVEQFEKTVWIDTLQYWIQLWRMPTFFVLAGFFGCMMLQRRGALGFLQDRLMRIGLTLLVFVPIYEQLVYQRFILGHLWFLYYLIGVCAVASGLAWAMSRYGIFQSFAVALTWPAKSPLRLGFYLIPVTILTPFARPTIHMITPETFSDFQLLPFLYYGLWFGIGAALYWHRLTLSAIEHWGMIIVNFLVAVIATWGLLHVLSSVNVVELPRYNRAIYCSAVSTTTWCLFFIGLCHRLLKKENRVVTWLVEISYPIYILHVFPSMVFGVIFINLGWSASLAFWPTVLGSFAISVIAYYTLIKFTPIDWLLAGPKKAWFRPQWIGLGRSV